MATYRGVIINSVPSQVFFFEKEFNMEKSKFKRRDEIWKTIKNYEGWYEVSNKGRIKQIKKRAGTPIGKILKLGNCFGYNRVELNKNANAQKFRVGRLAAFAFIGFPNKNQQINHKNGIKNDDRIENLEWVTPSENTLHSRRILGHCRGELNGLSKLTKIEVIEIKKLLKKNNITQVKISKIFNVTPQAIYQIKKGANWSWI